MRSAPVRQATPWHDHEMLTLRLADPGRVIVGWPELPLLALTTIVGGRTRVIGFDPGGDERWAALVDDELRGGLMTRPS